jgi:uncharacterized protein with PIN domain
MDPCFAAEKTLGKLAKWLRILGFDTSCEPDFPNSTAWELTDNRRIFLTRRQSIRDKTSSSDLIFIKSDHLFEQLKEVIQKLALEQKDTRPFSRCLQCNATIEAVDKDSVRNAVPDYIWETHDTFQRCGTCRKIYWPGSHTKRTLDIIEGLFDEDR